MSAAEDIFVGGVGVVSPAGWGLMPFREALDRGEPIATTELTRPGWSRPLQIRKIPGPAPRSAFTTNPRLRRTSPIAQYAVAAAIEAMGSAAAPNNNGERRLGIVLCTMSGCVNYSSRFYNEVLKEPATASPLVFPETVYNSSASHLAALLGTTAVNYTLVGDPGTFIQGIAVAADWLADGHVDGCLVVGAEEMDWLTGDAMRLFDRSVIVSAGAGALYLTCSANDEPAVRLQAITHPYSFGANRSRAEAARLAGSELRRTGAKPLLCDGLLGLKRADRDEQTAWADWTGPRLSVKTILGEGLMAASVWQCVAAVDALRQNRCDAATVSVVGCNQQAIAAQFVQEPGENTPGK